MVCLAELFQIEGPNSPLGFGKVCIKPWAPSWILAPLITLNRWPDRKGESDYGRYVESMCPYLWQGLGNRVYPMPSSHTTTVTKQAWACHHSKPFMGENAELL